MGGNDVKNLIFMLIYRFFFLAISRTCLLTWMDFLLFGVPPLEEGNKRSFGNRAERRQKHFNTACCLVETVYQSVCFHRTAEEIGKNTNKCDWLLLVEILGGFNTPSLSSIYSVKPKLIFWLTIESSSVKHTQVLLIYC